MTNGLERDRNQLILEAERLLSTLRAEADKIGVSLEIQTPWAVTHSMLA